MWASTPGAKREPRAFAQAALGVFALIVTPEQVVEARASRGPSAGGLPERLLVAWINECLYVHEIEGFVVRRVDVDACAETVVHGVLHGEEIDLGRHRPGTVVKAATLHQVLVTQSDGRHEVRVIVDV